MKKFRELSLINQVIRVYIFSIIIALTTSPLFNRFYIFIFKPARGGKLFFPASDFVGDLIIGTIFAFYLFLPFFVFWLIKDKQWLVWFIGVAFPLSIAVIGGGVKETFWALILTAVGWLLAQGILLICHKVKKEK